MPNPIEEKRKSRNPLKNINIDAEYYNIQNGTCKLSSKKRKLICWVVKAKQAHDEALELLDQYNHKKMIYEEMLKNKPK